MKKVSVSTNFSYKNSELVMGYYKTPRSSCDFANKKDADTFGGFLYMFNGAYAVIMFPSNSNISTSDRPVTL